MRYATEKMRYSAEQLLLAAKVLELAEKLAAEALESEKRQVMGAAVGARFGDLVAPVEIDEWQLAWSREHPMDEFLHLALEHIESAADYIFQNR